MFMSKITILCLAICTIKGAHLPQPFGGGGVKVGVKVSVKDRTRFPVDPIDLPANPADLAADPTDLAADPADFS